MTSLRDFCICDQTTDLRPWLSQVIASRLSTNHGFVFACYPFVNACALPLGLRGGLALAEVLCEGDGVGEP